MTVIGALTGPTFPEKNLPCTRTQRVHELVLMPEQLILGNESLLPPRILARKTDSAQER
jgi:hypothetical protein